ncbi:MAG: Polyhydroxybutyrate depolymerase [Hydrocarboniphaga sp.]|uniref:alpha/beta hydrolase family esterase n=1 Tax=Hydrocarboniphaga sp. TaxID=2033016 RepID=UPI002622E6E4|nr:alpha/beta fold hydrolase [Hydrocarboniphaga sp.]MDB5967631.1 Polyhydroxybutyrate depolymerase [Hydrocarboniphaga sp.]
MSNQKIFPHRVRLMRKLATLLTVGAVMLSLDGCLAVRGVRMVQNHEATKGFPDKGDVSTAQQRKLIAGGLQRSYLVQIPGGASAPMPIVVILHGGTETAEDAWKQTSLPTLGARERFIVAAPQGVDKHWNDGRGSTLAGDSVSSADDVAFIRNLIAELVLRDHGDARAVFIIGASNGGFMAMNYACQAGDTLRAGANVISTLPAAVARNCRAGKPLPWLSMNGKRDSIVPFAGMPEGTLVRGKPQPGLLSADATFQFWANRAGCSASAQTTRVSDTVEKRVRSCANGTTSQQYVFSDAGHVWPGLAINSAMIASYLGGTNLDVDTGEVAWGFFKSALARP